MNLKSSFIYIIAAFMSLNMALAQSNYHFKFKYDQNSTYLTTLNSKSNISIDMANMQDSVQDSEALAMPMTMDLLQNFDVILNTGEQNEDNSIPAKISYDKMEMSQSLNGQQMPNMSNMFPDVVIEATLTPQGEFIVDNVGGEKLTTEMKDKMSSLIGKMTQVIIFPDESLEIGESFTNEVPLEIPVMGKSHVMKVTTKYTLEDVKDGFAYFTYDQDLENSFDINSMKMKTNGTGQGSAVFDMQDGYFTEQTSKMNLKAEVEMNAGGKNVNMNMNMNMDAKIAIKKS